MELGMATPETGSEECSERAKGTGGVKTHTSWGLENYVLMTQGKGTADLADPTRFLHRRGT